MSCTPYNQPNWPDFGIVVYTAEAGQTTFTIPYDYLLKDIVEADASTPMITVWVNGSSASYTLGSATTIVLDTAADEGDTVAIIRDSQISTRQVQWTNSTPLNAANMELFSKQVQYLIQEIWSRVRRLGCSLSELENGTITEYLATGDATTVTFALDGQEELVESQILVFINGVRQANNTYSVADSGGSSQVTFDEAPPSGAKISFVVIDAALVAQEIADGSVDCDKLSTGAVCSLDKFDLDGAATTKQIAGWLDNAGTVEFGPYSIDASWITSFHASVRLNRLDQMTAPTASVSMNSQKITNLANGTASGDAVNLGQLNAIVGEDERASIAITVNSGVNATATVTGLDFEPVAVTVLAVFTYNGKIYEINQAFNFAGSTETRRTVAGERTDGTSRVFTHALVLTSDGFTWTLPYQGGFDPSSATLYYTVHRS